MRVPRSARKPIERKCPICNKKCKSRYALVEHINSTHTANIPTGWDAPRYENYLRTKKDHGNCVVCHGDTTWNSATWKYNRICTSQSCRAAIAKQADANNIRVHGQAKLANDPEHQRKMVYGKHTSGNYEWSTQTEQDRYVHMYASKVELEFLQMLDLFLNLDPFDVVSPSPNTYTYQYEGKELFYIPDVYIVSLGLEIELKEPVMNQNMHPKIQAVDKVKERLKDEMMAKRKDCLYIKINGSDYQNFFALLDLLKERDELIPNANKIEHALVREGAMVEGEETMSLSKIILEQRMTKDRRYENIEDLVDQIDNIKELYHPMFNYDGILDRYRGLIITADSETTLATYRQELDAIDHHLTYMITKDDGNSRMRNAATKTKNTINGILRPLLQSKLTALKEDLIFWEGNDVLQPLTEGTEFSAKKDRVVYKPVFVLLSYNGTAFNKLVKFWTSQEWTHASVSLDTTLLRMASFAHRRNGEYGFVFDEGIDMKGFLPESKYALYMYMATKEEYQAVVDCIDSFKVDYTRWKYSVRGILNFAFARESNYANEMFCSQFVAHVIKAMNPNIITKDSSLYSPGDIGELPDFTLIDRGELKDYDARKVDRVLRRLLQERGYTNVQIK